MLPKPGSRVVIRIVDFDRYYDRVGRANTESNIRRSYEHMRDTYDGRHATVIHSHYDPVAKAEVVTLRITGISANRTALFAEDVILEQIQIEEDVL